MDSIKKNTATILWLIIGVSLAIHILSFVIGKVVLVGWRFTHEPLHSSVEMSGSVIALLVAYFLVNAERLNRGTSFNMQIAAALIAMGLFDGFHATVHTGNLFVWLHSVASFTGGLLFAFIWLPKYWIFIQSFSLLLVVFLITLGIGIYSFMFPDSLPMMVYDGRFSSIARWLNMSGGILLIFSASRLICEYFSSRNTDDLLFCLHCILFGAAAIMFQYSSLWDAPWWGWHILRLLAYFVAVLFVAISENSFFLYY